MRRRVILVLLQLLVGATACLPGASQAEETSVMVRPFCSPAARLFALETYTVSSTTYERLAADQDALISEKLERNAYSCQLTERRHHYGERPVQSRRARLRRRLRRT